MARFLSPHPDDPTLAFYEDDNGQPFIAPAEMQTGIEQEAQPPAQQMPTTDAEVLAQLNQMGQDLGEDRLGGMGASEPLAWNGQFAPQPGQMLDVSDSSLAPGAFTPEPGAMFTSPQEEEPVAEEAPPTESAGMQVPHVPGYTREQVAEHLATGGSLSELRQRAHRAIGVDPFGTQRTFVEPETPSGGGRREPANATAGILSGTAVPGEVMNELDAASEQQAEAARRAALVQMQTAEQQSGVMDEELAADNERVKRMEMQVEQWQEDAHQKVQELNGFLQQMSEQNINPDRFFAQRGDAARFGAAVSIAASAMGQVLAPGTPNTAMTIINAAIERDVQAQLANMQNTQATVQAGTNVFRTLMEHYKDQQSAMAALRAIRLQQADNRLRGIALRNQSPAAWAAYEQQRAEIASRIAAVHAELQSRQFQINMSGPMAIPAITQTVNAIEERSATGPEATDFTRTPEGFQTPAQRHVGTAKTDAEGNPEFPSTDPAILQESLDNRIRQEQFAAGVPPEPEHRRQVGRRIPQGQNVARRQPGESSVVGGVPAQHGHVFRTDEIVPAQFQGNPSDYYRAIMESPDWPADLVIVDFGSRGQVQRISEGIVERAETEALNRREAFTAPVGNIGVIRAIPGQEHRFNEAIGSERGERVYQDLQAVPEGINKLDQLISMMEGWGQRAPGTEERGRAEQLYIELIRDWSRIDGSGVLNEGEREFFLTDRIPDITDLIQTPASRQRLLTARREAFSRAQSIARGIHATFSSPETVGEDPAVQAGTGAIQDPGDQPTPPSAPSDAGEPTREQTARRGGVPVGGGRF